MAIPWWRRPADVTAVALLVVLPALVFGVPALIGHPVLPGDDMTQNFPLRVLAGREIRSGHLPLFDAYAWSGTPLLAGWNAGAAYPLTWLFAVLPGLAAWATGLIVTWATTGTGLFCFLRALRLGSLPAFLGALSFALAGAMSAQVPHFGLVAGMSWVPLQLLAVLRLSGSSLTDRADSSASRVPVLDGRRLRWTAVLALTFGLMILAGEPRAIVDGCAITGLYALWRVARVGRSAALPAALLIGCGILLGACLGAVQWLPGLAAISTSQRGSGSLALFSSGSLPPQWLLLTLVPDLLGGSGSLSQPAFFAGYNLTEVTSYVGILPLVAAFVLLARAFEPGPDGRRRVPEWLIWHVQGLAGIVLALGGNTPLGAVFHALPLFGGQRLQSRNILVLDLALAVLLAYWLDKPFSARRRLPAERLAALVPTTGILIVVALGLTGGAGLLRWLGIGAGKSTQVIGRLQPWLLPYAVLAAGAIALVIYGRRFSRRGWARACAVFVAADIIAFTFLGVVAVAPSGSRPAPPAQAAAARASATRPGSTARLTSGPAHAADRPTLPARSAARPVSELGYPGRFAIYDPDLLDGNDLSVLGPPNVNDINADGMPSVQGYSSIVDGNYASATGSHSASGDGQDFLAPSAVGNGTLDALDTSILLTVPAYLTTASRGALAAPGPPGTGRRTLAPDGSATWYLGESAVVSRVTVPDRRPRADVARIRIGLTAPDGRTRWFRPRAASASTLDITLPRPMAAVAVAGEAGTRAGHVAPTVLGPPSLTLAGGGTEVADGQLQDALVPPRWVMAGFDGGFAVFADRFAAGPLTVQPLPGRPGTSGRDDSGDAGRVQPLTRMMSPGGTAAGTGRGTPDTAPDRAMSPPRASAAGMRPSPGAREISAAGASVRYVTGAAGQTTMATVSSAHGVRLLRSMAAIPGWSATWQPRGGRPVPLSVRRDGVVQAVDVPPGQGTVTWRYTTPRLETGLAVSATAALLTLILSLADGRWGRSPAKVKVP